MTYTGTDKARELWHKLPVGTRVSSQGLVTDAFALGMIPEMNANFVKNFSSVLCAEAKAGRAERHWISGGLFFVKTKMTALPKPRRKKAVLKDFPKGKYSETELGTAVIAYIGRLKDHVSLLKHELAVERNTTKQLTNEKQELSQLHKQVQERIVAINTKNAKADSHIREELQELRGAHQRLLDGKANHRS